MSKLFSHSVLLSIHEKPTSDRLLDDCALDLSLGVLRRTAPRTYANRVPTAESGIGLITRVCRGFSQMLVKSEGLCSASGLTDPLAESSQGSLAQPKPLEDPTMVSKLVSSLALVTGLLAFVVGMALGMIQCETVAVALSSGSLAFASVWLSVSLFGGFGLRLMAWLGVDVEKEFRR